MKKDTFGNDVLLEILFSLITLSAVLFMVTGLFFLATVPINNYHHAAGFVEFKRQYKVITQREGSIIRIFTDNYALVERETALCQFTSESNEREIDALNVRLKYLQKELITLDKLFYSGAINRPEVEIKRLEIQEVETRLKDYQRNTIYAPIAGRVYYKVLPEYMQGSYIEKGEVIAYIYSSPEKHICITFPNTFADRFKVGGPVLFKYSDPVSFKVKKMKGFIYKTFIDKNNNALELYCDLDGGGALLDIFHPFTKIDAAIIINSTSLCNDMFGVDPFPAIKRYFKQFSWYKKTVTFIKNET